jgi:MFS family permease
VLFERVPSRLQARVLGAVKASAWVGIPFGSLVGGLLAQTAGLRGALLACGVVMLLATIPPFVFPAWRGLDRRTARTPVQHEPSAFRGRLVQPGESGEGVA